MATKVRAKIRKPLGLEEELIPFAGQYHYLADALGDGGDTKWGADAGQTEVPLPKLKKVRVKRNG